MNARAQFNHLTRDNVQFQDCGQTYKVQVQKGSTRTRLGGEGWCQFVGVLKDLLHDHDRIDIHVSCITSKKPMLIRMKMGARSNNAILTSGWNMVVRKFKLREDDKVLFCFSKRDDGDLDLLVEFLPLVVVQ
jgi:hypothetical protein